MQVDVKWGKRTNSTYPVTGRTLKEVEANLSKREDTGQFTWQLPFPDLAVDADHTITAVTLRPRYDTKMPSWRGYTTQPKRCQDEWDAMWRALREHEAGHQRIFEQSVNRYAASLKAAGSMKSGSLTATWKNFVRDTRLRERSYDTKNDRGSGGGPGGGVRLFIPRECAA